MRCLFCALALSAMALPVNAGVILQLPLDPNYQAQLPFPYVAPITDTGPLTEFELNKEFPQYNYAFDGLKIGYFDIYNPAKDVIWTALLVDLVIPDATPGSVCVGLACNGPAPCFGLNCGTPPPCTGPNCGTPPLCTGPDCGNPPPCTGPDCGTPPLCTGPDCGGPGPTIPEPATWTAALIGLALLGARALHKRT